MKKYFIDYEEVSAEEFKESLEEELKNEVEIGIDGWIDSFVEEEEGVVVCGCYLLSSEVLKKCLPNIYNYYKLEYEERLKQEIEDQFSRGATVNLNCCDFEIEEIEEDEE